MAEEILQAEGLVKRFDGLTAVNHVDLSLAAGEVRALIGPNGAGKTTLINLLAGQLRPDRGSIMVAGHDVVRWPAHWRARLGLARTFQIGSLFPQLTVREHIGAALQAGRLRLRWDSSVDSEVEELVELCQLEGKLDLRAQELSHGERRLLELAVALASQPKLLLLDEPTAGLSPAETRILVELIASLKDITILIVEHDMQVVFRLAQRLTVMHHGQILAEGAPEEIQRDPRVQEVYLEGS